MNLVDKGEYSLPNSDGNQTKGTKGNGGEDDGDGEGNEKPSKAEEASQSQSQAASLLNITSITVPARSTSRHPNRYYFYFLFLHALEALLNRVLMFGFISSDKIPLSLHFILVTLLLPRFIRSARGELP